MIAANNEEVWPSGGVPQLESIGQSLGRITRFNGHTAIDYPVLAHSLVVAALMPKSLGIFGLMHDAQECATSDVPTPWKTEAARKREMMLLRRIYTKHLPDVSFPLTEEIQSAVDIADHLALAAEAQVIGHPAVDRIWPERDAYACALTRGQTRILATHTLEDGTEIIIRVCDTYRNPKVSVPKFIEAFNMYKAEYENSLVSQNAGVA
jgi:hypothetical protein